MKIKTSIDIKKLKEFKEDIKRIWGVVINREVERAVKKGWIDDEGLYLQGAYERFYIWRW